MVIKIVKIQVTLTYKIKNIILINYLELFNIFFKSELLKDNKILYDSLFKFPLNHMA